MKTRTEKYLRLVSTFTSAPFVAAACFLFLAFLDKMSAEQLGVALLFGSVIPVGGVFVTARLVGSSLDIPDRSHRRQPLVFAIFSYVVGFLVLIWIRGSPLLATLMLAYAINTSIMLGVLSRTKLSIHAAGVVGPLSFIIFKLGPPFLFLYALVIPVGIVRILLREHTISEVALGAVVTVVATWIQIFFVLPIVSTMIA